VDIKDPQHLKIISDSFNLWYKAEIQAFVNRCDVAGLTPAGAAAVVQTVVRDVSQFTLARLVTELASVGITTDEIIEFLRKHATS
jgi:hypothetical protein